MRLIRFFLRCIFVMCLFMLGVSAADKEYLGESIIGVQVVGAESENLIEYITCMDASGAEDFCQKVKAYNRNLDVYVDQSYYDASEQDGILIPGGIYTTVFVKDGSGQKLSSFIKNIAPVNSRFYMTDEPVISYVQNSYISFLSFLGMAENLVINFQDGL